MSPHAFTWDLPCHTTTILLSCNPPSGNAERLNLEQHEGATVQLKLAFLSTNYERCSRRQFLYKSLTKTKVVQIIKCT